MNIKIYIVASIIYMFIGVLFGAVISGGPLADYVETEEGHWIENIHSFVSFNGFFALMLMGFSYFLIPQMTRRKIHSEKLVSSGFYIFNIGLIIMVISLALGSLSSGMMAGGILLTLGYFIFGYNILKSL
jgi:cbb3-type cytochrome oxidase subunit 1|tara:strand:+ start:41 stop:430 length:390 start_codon:yes stop_codon:yes gene_type:complete